MYNYSFFGGISAISAPARSKTPTPRSENLVPPLTLHKALSTSQIPVMTALASPQLGHNVVGQQDGEHMNTIPDPRTPSPSSQLRNSPSHPDLSNEVAMLSTKLVNAMNYQSNLDDSLQHTRQELDAAKQKIAQLEAKAQEQVDQITAGVLVKKAEVDANIEQMRAELAEARRERELSDKGKKQMEVELENLTTALFEEANTVGRLAHG
jgi:hypothetical protein